MVHELSPLSSPRTFPSTHLNPPFSHLASGVITDQPGSTKDLHLKTEIEKFYPFVQIKRGRGEVIELMSLATILRELLEFVSLLKMQETHIVNFF